MQTKILPHPYPVNPGAKRTAAAAAELVVPTDLSFVAYWTRSRKTYWTRPYSQPPPSPPNFFAAPVVSTPELHVPLTMREARRGPDATLWRQEEHIEFVKLLDDHQVMRFINPRNKPTDRLASYYNPQVRVKVKDNVVKRRVRGTYGGNLSDYQGETAAFTADLTTVKLLLNATVSEEGARFMTLDITDFYLCSPLERPEYMRIHRRDLPHETLLKYKDSLIFDGDFAMVEVTKSIYGLKQAGIIAQRRLIDLLARHNYNQAPNTRGLFTHATRPIAFSLVVDDFGVKYRDKADVEDLLRVLRLAYAVKEDWTGDAYIGLTIKHNFTARTISISMPGYVKAALSRFTASAASASHTPTHCPLPFTPVTLKSCTPTCCHRHFPTALG